MEIWQYIEILRRPNKTWFFSKDNTEEKIYALTKIANVGYPSIISNLTDFLKDDNKEIGNRAGEMLLLNFCARIQLSFLD